MQTGKLGILRDVLGSCYNSSEEHLFFCPYCKHHKRKLSVNVEKNVYKCWICDATGRNLGRLVRRFGSQKHRYEWSKFEDHVDVNEFEDLFKRPESAVDTTVDLPMELVSLTSRTPPAGSHGVLRYLRKRGITKRDILRWKIGFCAEGEYRDRVIIPSFNKSGYVNYFIARSYGHEWPKYKNPPVSKNIVFNELYIDWEEDVVLVEGIFDAIVAGNAVPLLGSTLRENSNLFQEVVKRDTPIYLALDPDAEKKTSRIIQSLLSYNITVYKIDVSGFEDVGEMSKEEFKARKENATLVQADDYLYTKIFNI